MKFLEVELEAERRVMEGKGPRREVSHKIYIGSIVYFWVPEGTIYPSAHTADRNFTDKKENTWTYYYIMFNQNLTHQVNGHDIHI